MGLLRESASRDTDHESQLKPDEKQLGILQAAGVPAVNLPDPCRSCDEPCPDWPSIEVDRTSALLGSTNPFARMVICATGKDNWAHSVTDETGSLEHAIQTNYDALIKSQSRPSLLTRLSSKMSLSNASQSQPPGLGPCLHKLAADARPDKLTILSGSNHAAKVDSGSFLVFPDFKVVHGVAPGDEGAEQAAKAHLLPSVERYMSTPFDSINTSSFPLPYRAVILICSHRNRDKRCAITAPPLIEEFKRALEVEDLGVDELGEVEGDESIEQWPETGAEERSQRFDSVLRDGSVKGDTVGIFKVSHFGGHKFAGNVYVCLPSGACMLYGRVTVTEVEAIVKKTILGGQVIECVLLNFKTVGRAAIVLTFRNAHIAAIREMLRGGVGLTSGGSSLLNW